jgi:hypothetical protein
MNNSGVREYVNLWNIEGLIIFLNVAFKNCGGSVMTWACVTNFYEIEI